MLGMSLIERIGRGYMGSLKCSEDGTGFLTMCQLRVLTYPQQASAHMWSAIQRETCENIWSPLLVCHVAYLLSFGCFPIFWGRYAQVLSQRTKCEPGEKTMLSNRQNGFNNIGVDSHLVVSQWSGILVPLWGWRAPACSYSCCNTFVLEPAAGSGSWPPLHRLGQPRKW